MSPAVHVAIHPSQFPEQVRRDLRESLRARQVNHKFHYDSVKQTQKWLALHEACSPARTDPDCAVVYDSAFNAAVKAIQEPEVHLIGLGCGGGQKDTRLLQLLRAAGKEVSYTPVDISVAMVLTARATAMTVLTGDRCHPVVCDLATAEDLSDILDELDRTKNGRKKGMDDKEKPLSPALSPLLRRGAREKTRLHQSGTVLRLSPNLRSHQVARLVTFFGMIPNFEPKLILPRLADLLRPPDCLLFSANLAPGGDYAAGVQRILPLYDNALTRDWLMTFLLDLGVERSDGELHYLVEDDAGGSGLKRVAAYFHFSRARSIALDDERFEFRPGESIRLFFSYRHTTARIRELLGEQHVRVLDEWITKSGEEGVFLCQRT